ncbi:hypothetical protein [Caldimonas tepidiphila]|uniref:hypothetical protein n=1 Tax=Caldimonas tepidiphila TaxID=2315841 RepID=UPI0013001AE2|nr:hypothetical protein [Caldimonas tepidiphila]
MIVGCETRGWNVLKKEEKFVGLADYIEKSLSKHKNFFANQLQQKNSKGFAFHNFIRSISAKCGKEGLIYSNLFCFSWNKGSPIGSPHFETIKKYSGTLLKAQITHFKPNIIIFANGINSAFYRREIFPIEGHDRVCNKGKDYHRTDDVSKHHLWEFELYDRIRCFRIHHPSSRSKEAIKARELLLKLLPAAPKNSETNM